VKNNNRDYPAFAPVIIGDACRGHLLASARGWRAFDREDREIGTYPTPEAAVAALLELAVA
jgi:hypothetical protein